MLLSRWALAPLAIALALAAANPVAAKPTAGQTCQASQLRAFSRFMKADFKCWSPLLKNPDADPGGTRLLSCLAKAADQLTAAYLDGLDAAGPGGCGLEAPVVELVDSSRHEVFNLVAAISTGYQGTAKAERSLHASLQKATGAALARALGAESKHAQKADEPKRQSARSRARAKLLSAFARAAAKAGGEGVPYAGLAADGVADEVDRITDALAALTLPGGSAFFDGGTIPPAGGFSIWSFDLRELALREAARAGFEPR